MSDSAAASARSLRHLMRFTRSAACVVHLAFPSLTPVARESWTWGGELWGKANFTHCHAPSDLLKSPDRHGSMLKQWRPSLSSSSRTLSACATLTPARAPGRTRRRRLRGEPMYPASRTTTGCARFCCGLGRREQLQEAVVEEDGRGTRFASLGARRRRRTCGASDGRVGQGQAGWAPAGGSARPSAAADTLHVRAALAAAVA